MSDENPFGLSRRRLLGGIATIGAAGALGGAGTMAFFSDEEQFANNRLMAGSLDMKAAYSAHYSDWSPDEGEGVEVRMWDGAPESTGSQDDLEPGETGLPTNEAWLIAVDDPEQFLDNTLTGEAGTATCPDGTDAEELEQPIIDLDDVKPGDFGEVTFDFALCDNPGYVWLQGDLISCAENGTTEPEEKDPDEASVAPLLAAGAIPSSSALAKSEVGEKVLEKVRGDSDSSVFNRRNALRAATAGVAGAAGLGAMTGAAAAAPGDLLGTVTLANNGDCSVAGTWDGTYYTTVDNNFNCANDVIQISVPPAGGTGAATLVAEKNVVDSGGQPVEISAVEWDPNRGKYWGAYDGTTYLIDRGDPTDGSEDAVVEDSFDSSDPHGFGIVDGLAIDDDDTLWYSPDVDTQVVKYDLSSGSRGDIIADIEPLDANGNVADHISGVAVGAPIGGRDTLYVGQNPGPADGNIIRIYADTGEYISNFATGTEFRVEDITCAPDLYDSEALLVKDSDVGEYKAFAVEEGTCPLSGGGGDNGDDGECADVELLDVVQVALWIDDGDNYQDGEEQPFQVMSLREALGLIGDATDEGKGVPLMGNMAAEDGGGTGEQGCFTAEEKHSLGFAWWVPIDHGNEIQTDSATFSLGFYTEQCRHNDGSGIETETPPPQ